jgi:hypothetical protein
MGIRLWLHKNRGSSDIHERLRYNAATTAANPPATAAPKPTAIPVGAALSLVDVVVNGANVGVGVGSRVGSEVAPEEKPLAVA